jgi:WD40 repeat protein
LTLSTNDVLRTWDLQSFSVRATAALAPQSQPVFVAVASGDGRLVATAPSQDPGISVWEVGSGTLKTSLKGGIPKIECLSLSSDARWVAASGGPVVELHERARPQIVTTLRGHKDGVTEVVFSPDGSLLATSSVDGSVKLWSVPARREVATLRGHREGVLGVAFSPDGRTLASAGAEGSVKLWNLPTLREIAWLRHGGTITGVRFSPDGRYFTFVCDHSHMVVLRSPSVAEVAAELSSGRSGAP